MACSLFLLSAAFQIEPAWHQWAVAATFALSFPAAAMLSAALLDRYCSCSLRPGPLLKAAPVAALLVLFEIGGGDVFMGEVIIALSGASPEHSLSIFLSISSSVLFCASVTTFAIMAAVLIFEASALWLMHAAGMQKQGAVSLTGIRTIAVLTLIFWCANLVSDLLVSELGRAAVAAIVK
ncbi:MAG: hypothetical protein J5J00_10225 [Deltaproteobacteria bacterium]|nr:hypothetical protein [Deltaproteobacteria bacterium]